MKSVAVFKTMKDKYYIYGLWIVGAFVILYILLKQKRIGISSAATISPTDAAVPQAFTQYPNTQPIQLGDIHVDGSPLNLLYNQLPGGQNSLPTVAIKSNTPGCECESSGCDAAGQFTTVNNIPASVATKLSNSVQSYTQKVSTYRTYPGGAWRVN